MDNNFNNLSLVQLVLKWKWHIIIITVVAALCGAIFSSSMFITPLYKSVAVAYPANISPYSDESETEQMLEIINSASIMDSVVEKYDLWADYKINKADKFAKTYMINEYRSKIKIGKTPYEGILVHHGDGDGLVGGLADLDLAAVLVDHISLGELVVLVDLIVRPQVILLDDGVHDGA